MRENIRYLGFNGLLCLGATTWEQLSWEQFLLGQTNGDKASYSPPPCHIALPSALGQEFMGNVSSES